MVLPSAVFGHAKYTDIDVRNATVGDEEKRSEAQVASAPSN